MNLQEALKVNHPIIMDIAARYARFGDISEAQTRLVLKLANEAQERHVAAPTGEARQTFSGVVVSVKQRDAQYGGQWRTEHKCTVKVVTADGATWLAWGTLPRNLVGVEDIVGRKVEITARLDSGKEPHFCFMNRPTGRLL